MQPNWYTKGRLAVDPRGGLIKMIKWCYAEQLREDAEAIERAKP